MGKKNEINLGSLIAESKKQEQKQQRLENKQTKKKYQEMSQVEGPESPYWKVTTNAQPQEGNQDSHQGTSQ